MVSANVTVLDAQLKELYSGQKLVNLTYDDHPLIQVLKKVMEFGGRELPIPIQFASNQAVGSDFGSAQAFGALSANAVTQFELTRKKFYGFTQIDNEAIESSKDSIEAWLPILTTQIDGTLKAMTNDMAVYLYGDGTGTLAQMANSTVSTSVVTLANADDIVKFEKGMQLDLAADPVSGSVRADGSNSHGLYVIAVDRTAGTFTVGTSPTGNTACDINDSADGLVDPGITDYIFRRKSRGAVLSGLGAWIPSTVASNDSFYGVNRSQDRSRLAGNFLDLSASAVPIQEALIRGAGLAAREQADIDSYFINISAWEDLVVSLDSKVRYVDVKTDDADVGFRGVQIQGPKGPIDVYPDRWAPSDRAYGLQLDTWELRSVGDFIRQDTSDGLQMLRLSTADGTECRFKSYSNLCCSAPGKNICVKFK